MRRNLVLLSAVLGAACAIAVAAPPAVAGGAAGPAGGWQAAAYESPPALEPPPGPDHGQPPAPPAEEQQPGPAGPAARQDCECERFEVTIRPAGRYEYRTSGRRDVHYVVEAALTCSPGDDPDRCWAWFEIENPSKGRILTPGGQVFGTVFCQGQCGRTIVVTRRFVLRTSGPPPYTVRFTVEKSGCGEQEADSDGYAVTYDGGGWPGAPKPDEPPANDPPKPAEDCECERFDVIPRLENAHAWFRDGTHHYYMTVDAAIRCRPGKDPDGCRSDFTIGPASGGTLTGLFGAGGAGQTIACKADCGKTKNVKKKLKIIRNPEKHRGNTMSFAIRKGACGDQGPTTLQVTLQFGPSGWLQGMTVTQQPAP